ncbi:MAG: hypothetical protein ABI592_16020 [Acidobacteriota bacterium]
MLRHSQIRSLVLTTALALSLAACRQASVETAAPAATPGASTSTTTATAAGETSPGTAIETTTTTTTTRLVTVDPVEASQHNAARRRSRPAAPASQSAAPAANAPVTSASAHEVPVGTILRVEFEKTISTATARGGQTATGDLMDDLLADDDLVVAPSGARVRGRVESVASSGKLAGAAQMTFRLTELEVNGKWVPISTSAYERKGDTHTKRNAGYIAGGAAVGALLGQVLGRDTSATLVGAAAGAAAGTGAAALGGDLDFEIEAGRPIAFTLEESLRLPSRR